MQTFAQTIPVTMPTFIASVQFENGNENDFAIIGNAIEKQASRNKAVKNKILLNENRKDFQVETNAGLHVLSNTIRMAAEKVGKKYSFTIIRNKLHYN